MNSYKVDPCAFSARFGCTQRITFARQHWPRHGCCRRLPGATPGTRGAHALVIVLALTTDDVVRDSVVSTWLFGRVAVSGATLSTSCWGVASCAGEAGCNMSLGEIFPRGGFRDPVACIIVQSSIDVLALNQTFEFVLDFPCLLGYSGTGYSIHYHLS